MRKTLYFVFALFLIFASCEEPVLNAPFFPADNNHDGASAGSAGKVPEKLSASHGEKRSISLSWDIVSGAVFYYIYRANSPLDQFILCAETSSNQFTFNVPPGSTLYYRVSSVSPDGVESARSGYVMGTSLAQPVISDITDISEDSASVTWYMENVSGRTYKDNLLYIVYCFYNDVELAQVLLDASGISENRAVFNGLTANTRYDYQVEAYLRSNQSASEKSDKMDAATARRFRPGPPVELRAARGTAVNKIELTFALPDMVDIALGDNTFDPKPLYFTISKRLYSESGNNEYQLICGYLGINETSALEKTGGKTFDEYIPGETVSWTDNSAARGVKYEYLVQSYVDNTNRIISSSSSQAGAVGWALSNGEVAYGKTVYTLAGNFYEYARLPVIFNFDPKGELYSYAVNVKVVPIDDDSENNPDDTFIIKRGPFAYEEIESHTIEMDLTQKSTEADPGRGIYSVEVEVKLPESGNTIYIFKALGSIQVSEDTQPIVVENFHIQDGYADKFVLIWDNYSNRKYIIEQSDDGEDRDDGWTEIDSVNDDPVDEDETVIESFKFIVAGQTPGKTAYFRIRPARSDGLGDFKYGQRVYAPAARTLGVPELSLGSGSSYSTITPLWTEAQKADVYRIKYKYTDAGAEFKVAAVIGRDELSLDAAGRFKFPFSPEGYDNALMAGKEIQITVDALNEGLRAEAGGGEISTSSSEDVRTFLVGPALLKLTASTAVSPQYIDVSWDSVHGAGGYYVFRRQFNMTNTAEEGIESIVYYIPASTSSSVSIIGKNLETDASNSKIDAHEVKASVSFANSRYTLRDMYLTDNEYDGAVYSRHSSIYRDQQNDLIQGMPYRYFVVPVIVRGNVPDPLNMIEFHFNKDGQNKNTSIASFTVREGGADIQYSGVASLEREGFAIGFGQNVTAAKGTYASQGNTNDGILVTWNPPPRLSTVQGFTPRYTVYRRSSGSSTWVPVTSIDNAAVCVDAPQARGVAYEYAVGISNAGGTSASVPQHSRRFISLCANQRDERDRPNMLGFMLSMVRMESVSRSELRDSHNNFTEEVKWYSAGIDNSYNSGEFNWGVDGYEVFVMNRNIDAAWHTIADIKSIPNQINLSVKVSDIQGGDTLQSGLLKVMRDYKHYFKVRSYVLNDGEKVFSPDPDWNYEILFAQSSNRNNQDRANFLETDYVKWGARQITPLEFARISTLTISWVVHSAAGNARTNWVTRSAWIRWNDHNGNNGGSGKHGLETNAGVTRFYFNIQNYKPDMDTNANRGNWTYSVIFLSIDTGATDSGQIVTAFTARTSEFPQRYGAYDSWGGSFLSVNGPACVAPLYSGQLRFRDLTWTGGNIEVRYPSGSPSVNITSAQNNTPLPFQQQNPTGLTTDSRRYQTDAWY